MSPPQLYKRGLVLNNQLTLTTEMSFGSLGQQALIDVQRQVSLAGFRRPSHLFLLSRRPEFALLLQALALLQLLLPEVAAQQGVAVLIHPVGEVLAGDADAAALPSLQLPRQDRPTSGRLGSIPPLATDHESRLHQLAGDAAL